MQTACQPDLRAYWQEGEHGRGYLVQELRGALQVSFTEARSGRRGFGLATGFQNLAEMVYKALDALAGDG